MRKIELGDIGIAVLWIIVFILLFVLSSYEANAQDSELYVCRDASIVGRFEFRNIPQEWTAYWYLADGLTQEGDTLLADALTEYPDDSSGITAGMVVLGNMDYSVEIRGDVQTPMCDLQNAPMPLVVVNNSIVATGRTCTVKYPEIILVCNG